MVLRSNSVIPSVNLSEAKYHREIVDSVVERRPDKAKVGGSNPSYFIKWYVERCGDRFKSYKFEQIRFDSLTYYCMLLNRYNENGFQSICKIDPCEFDSHCTFTTET